LSALPITLGERWKTYGRLVKELDGYANGARHFAETMRFQRIVSVSWKLRAFGITLAKVIWKSSIKYGATVALVALERLKSRNLRRSVACRGSSRPTIVSDVVVGFRVRISNVLPMLKLFGAGALTASLSVLSPP
jgi:hypothetical protein